MESKGDIEDDFNGTRARCPGGSGSRPDRPLNLRMWAALVAAWPLAPGPADCDIEQVPPALMHPHRLPVSIAGTFRQERSQRSG
jgi:hypothetical protein